MLVKCKKPTGKLEKAAETILINGWEVTGYYSDQEYYEQFKKGQRTKWYKQV